MYFARCGLRSAAYPSVLYADQQACETLVAVSYLDAAFDAAHALDKEAQHRLNADFLTALAHKTQLHINVDSAQGAKALAEVRSGRVDLIIGVTPQSDPDAQLDYLKPRLCTENLPLMAASRRAAVLAAMAGAEWTSRCTRPRPQAVC